VSALSVGEVEVPPVAPSEPLRPALEEPHLPVEAVVQPACPLNPPPVRLTFLEQSLCGFRAGLRDVREKAWGVWCQP
jgi:hypothetical protein